MSEATFAHLACPNRECSSYGQTGKGNLHPHGWSGRGHRIRCLRCSICGKNFSERTNTPLFDLRTPEDVLVSIAEHLVDGCGARATARLCKVSLNTVLRFTQRFGKHAESFHDTRVRGVQPKEVQLDEAWAFVGKKDKHVDPLDPDDAQQGSFWDHVIIDAETKLIVSVVVGRRIADTVVQLVSDFYERTDGFLPEILVSDGYVVYEPVIIDCYGLWQEELELTPEDQAAFDRVGMPPFYFPEEISYAKVVKVRESSRVVAVESEVVLGSQQQVDQALSNSTQSEVLNTSFAERWFGTQRQFNGRKKRKAYTFSKDLSFHVACTWLVVVWYNFGWCVRTLQQKIKKKPPRYLRRTPAMAAGLSDHPWTMRELLRTPIYPPKDPPPKIKVRTYQEVLQRINGAGVGSIP